MGAQLRVYRQKIRSAQTTKKITRAMELISASRIQRAQARVEASGPYSRAVTRAVSRRGDLLEHRSRADHRAGEDRARRGADLRLRPGLAGAFNSNVLRAAEELATLLRSQGKDVVYYLVGRKAVGYFSFRKRPARADLGRKHRHAPPGDGREIGEALVDAFLTPASEGGVDEIHIVYNRFVSMVTQVPEVVRLLPLEVVEGVEPPAENEVFPLYAFEPEVGDVLDALLPVYIESRIFNAMLQSAASEVRRDAEGNEGGERQRRQTDPRLHQAGEQRSPVRDHPTDFRDRGRRRRSLGHTSNTGEIGTP